MSDNVIKVPILTRVEGEGGLTVRMGDGHVEEVQLRIFEAPRLFEALLRGRPLEDAPDITARICGICPVAYQMSSVHALEKALGITVTPTIRRLRTLLYCGEWIESHGLHIHLLHAPDFFGAESGIELAKRFPNEVNRGLQLKKMGNRLLDVLGGRAIHPINVRVGGFYRIPTREQRTALIPDFEKGLEAAIETARWVAQFDFPDFDRPYEMVALTHPDEYAMNEGEIATTDGLRIPAEEFENEFFETHVSHSTALHAVRRTTKKPYLVGPLARLNINRSRLSPAASRIADEIGFPTPCLNPYQSITARALELVHAFETALEILKSPGTDPQDSVTYERRRGRGCAATEAPRGLLYHRYETTDDGLLEQIKIIPPTSQNQRQIESDLFDWLTPRVSEDRDELARGCERIVRCYDPCISCSTHFLKVQWENIS